jgi:hypothetical protein
VEGKKVVITASLVFRDGRESREIIGHLADSIIVNQLFHHDRLEEEV